MKRLVCRNGYKLIFFYKMDYDLLSRYLVGDTTPEERVEVYEWIKSSKKNEDSFNSLRKLQDISIWNKREEPIKQKNKRKNVFLLLTQVAAVFVLIWGTYSVIQSLQIDESSSTHLVSKNLKAHSAPPGEYIEISLIDGTHVWLNSKSSLTYDSLFSNNERIVTLQGEAFFDVAQNNDKPFKVKVGDYVVKVTGTEFNVKSYQYFETSLVSGSVIVENVKNGNIINLQPSQRVREKERGFIVSDIDENDLLWRSGILSINDKTIDEIIPILERYYEVEFVFDDKSFDKEKKYTGKFRISDGVEQILMILQIHNEISYTMDEQKILLN